MQFSQTRRILAADEELGYTKAWQHAQGWKHRPVFCLAVSRQPQMPADRPC